MARNPEDCFDEEWQVNQYKEFVAGLVEIFRQAKHEKRRGSAVVKEYDERLRAFALRTRKEERNLVKLMNYLLSYEGEWFTFLKRWGIEPTNNRCERALRPMVIHRKVSQHTRSGKGLHGLEVTQSIYETCKLRGENFAELVRH